MQVRVGSRLRVSLGVRARSTGTITFEIWVRVSGKIRVTLVPRLLTLAVDLNYYPNILPTCQCNYHGALTVTVILTLTLTLTFTLCRSLGSPWSTSTNPPRRSRCPLCRSGNPDPDPDPNHNPNLKPDPILTLIINITITLPSTLTLAPTLTQSTSPNPLRRSRYPPCH